MAYNIGMLKLCRWMGMALCLTSQVLAADPDPKVLEHRKQALAEIAGVDSEDAEGWANAGSPRSVAASILESQKDPKRIDRYRLLFRNSDPFLREFAVQMAGMSSDNLGFAEACRLTLEDPASSVRVAGVWNLPMGFSERMLPTLRKVLENPKEEDEVLSKAIQQAAGHRAPWLVEIARLRLTPKVSHSVAQPLLSALAEVPSLPAVELLAEVVSGKMNLDPSLRSWAVGGLESVAKDKDPSRAKAATRALIAALAEETDRTVLTALGQYVASLPLADPSFKELVPALEKAFARPLPENATERLPLYVPKAQLARVLYELGVPPKNLMPRLLELAGELSRGTGGDHVEEMRAFEFMRESLPKPLQDELDQTRRQNLKAARLERAKRTSPCEVLCSLVKRLPDWSQEEFYIRAEGPPEETVGWTFATRSLGVLFLVKAAPYCPEAKTKYQTLRDKWLAQPPPKAADLPKNPTGEQLAKKKDPETDLKAVLEMLKVGLDAEAIARLEAFANATAGATAEAPPTDAPTVYGKQFYGLFLREVLRDPSLTASDQLKVALALRSNERSLHSDLSQFMEARTGIHGSLFNTYAFATSLLSLPVPPRNAMQRLDELVATARTPSGIDYNPLPGGNSPRSGTARAVPVQLAAYLKLPPGADRAAQRDRLESALETYLLHTPSFQAHVGHNDVHLGPDGLAPYYYYPTVPYATSALRRLETEATDPKQKERYREQRLELYAGLLGMLQDEGIFKPQGQVIAPEGPPAKPEVGPGIVGVTPSKAGSPGRKSSYSSSPAYVNPLAGLALVALVDICDGKPVTKSFGIIDEATEQSIPRGSPSDKGADRTTHPTSTK